MTLTETILESIARAEAQYKHAIYLVAVGLGEPPAWGLSSAHRAKEQSMRALYEHPITPAHAGYATLDATETLYRETLDRAVEDDLRDYRANLSERTTHPPIMTLSMLCSALGGRS